MQDLWIEVKGLRTFARISLHPAAGRLPVVLVHGYGMSSRYMAPIAGLLAVEHTVYAPDLPGHGRSGNPQNPLAIPALAEHLRAWMDAAGIGRAAFLGNSMGCQVLAELAACHPGQVDRLILVAPTVEPSARTFRRQLPRFVKDAAAERFSLLLLGGREFSRMGLWRLYREMKAAFADRIEDKLPRIPAPSLVVRGERDAVVPQGWAEEVARGLRDGELRVIQGEGHALNYSAAGKLMAVIRPFLEAGTSPEERAELCYHFKG
jgi:2-hydroxy-6-oxonona-2,4-dienedioate hydrolase